MNRPTAFVQVMGLLLLLSSCVQGGSSTMGEATETTPAAQPDPSSSGTDPSIPTVSCKAPTQPLHVDICLHRRIAALPPSKADQVRDLVLQIPDPVVRGAAVFNWVTRNNRDIPRNTGRELCSLLSGQERITCERRLSSQHLQQSPAD